MTPLYPLINYTYNNLMCLEVNLENLVIYHKHRLLKAYLFIEPKTTTDHGKLINVTNEIVEVFKTDIEKFENLPNNEVKWEWIGKIKAEQTIILEKSATIVNKSYPL